jgi:uncharacterized protein (DUF433 family)
MANQRVTSADQARDNILRFAEELSGCPQLAGLLAYTRAWYAVRGQRGQWKLAPSKFAGYPKNTAKDYLRTNRTGHDGGASERALTRWFQPVKPGTALHEELLTHVHQLFKAYDKVPNRLLRINVLTSDADGPGRSDSSKRPKIDRVISRADICGGRPCIRGMRIRVSDILDLLAAGENREQILLEYPYLEPDDIDAALAYAARSVDHRVIEAA